MYFETIENGYTIAITTVYGQTRIAKERYDAILSLFHAKPEAEDGYDYMLRADTLEWELVELPPSEDEPSAEDPTTPAWDISQSEYIPEGFLLTRDGVVYKCLVGHYAAWNKQPPNDEYWRAI